MPTYAFETMPVGLELPFGPKRVTEEEIIEFAREFDPAPFHIDEQAAKNSVLGKLSASGFHTCCMTMRMICDAYLLDSTSEGAPGLEECRWTKPVCPGDTLSGRSTILSSRQSKSRPENAIMRIRHETENQAGETVLSMTTINIFRLNNPGLAK